MELGVFLLLIIAIGVTSGVTKMNKKAALPGAIIQLCSGAAIYGLLLKISNETDMIYVSVVGAVLMTVLGINVGTKMERKK